MCVDDESIDDDPKLWWACQAIIPFGGGIDFFRLGACTPNPLGDLRHHNPNPSEQPNDERRKSWPYLESRTLMFITE
jgi:hypothetical protein